MLLEQSPDARAFDRFWVCGNGPDWDSFGSATPCWAALPGNPGIVNAPGDGDNPYLIQAGSTNITVEYYQPDPEPVFGHFYVDATGSGTMTFSQVLTNHEFYTALETIGYSGTGAVVLSQGLHSVSNDIVLGDLSTGYGSYNISGSGYLAARSEIVGNAGSGVITQTGGTNAPWLGVHLGQSTTGTGTYNLSGNGNLLSGDTIIGVSGTGIFNQSGGSHSVTTYDLSVGWDTTGHGTYSLSDGILSAPTQYIGRAGTGIFNQTGGSNSATTIILGDSGTGNGNYDLANGSVTTINEYVGYAGTGTFTQGGGSNNVTGIFSLGEYGGSNGTYHLTGGTLSASNEDVGYSGSGTFIQNGGTNSLSGNLNIGTSASGNGSYDLNGGTLQIGGSIQYGAGTGVFNFNGGTLHMLNGLVVGPTGVLAGQTLGGAHTLAVDGTTTLNGGSVLTLDGGTFTTGALANNGFFDFKRGTFNLTADNLLIGAGGLFGDNVQFGLNQTVNVTLDTTIDFGAVLSLANGSFSSSTTTNNGTVNMDGILSTLGGAALVNNSLLSGDGRITAYLTNATTGEIRATSGNTLTFTASGNSNDGRINLLGGTAGFTQDLANNAGGLISGRGTLVVGGGLTNLGSMGFSSGNTDIFGDVNNGNGGIIIASGNSTLTFYDDVVHNGSEIRVSAGSNAVFFGAVSGSGPYTGSGTVFFEGDLLPGSSPGLVGVEGSMSLGSSARTFMELGGLWRGTEYDAFDVGATLSLGGLLEVALYDLGGGVFDPQLGDSFDLFLADTILGSFDDLSLAVLGHGLGWRLDILPDAVGLQDALRLSVVSAVPLPPAAWLFLAGLFGLVGIARRRAA